MPIRNGTLLKLVDPIHLAPTSCRSCSTTAIRNSCKINLALSAVPEFTAFENGASAALKGRIQHRPEIDYLERAFDESKYGKFSNQPYLEVTIPLH